MNTTETELRALMEEDPGGANYGRRAKIVKPEDFGKWQPLSQVRRQAREFLTDGGWTMERGTAHRGVLHPDEHVDESVLLAAVENELGFTIEDVRSVYRQGRMTETQRELRGLIDSRLLALSRSGANLLELARIFGWTIKPASARGGASCDTMERAIARARSAETVAA